jgi:hypothetical protein
MNTSSFQADRRNSRRMPVTVNAVLYYNSLMLPGCEIRDLSPDGAFILTDGQFLPDQAQIDVALPQLSPKGLPGRIPAQVIRSTGEGVGVRLLPGSPAIMRSLVEMFYSLPA